MSKPITVSSNAIKRKKYFFSWFNLIVVYIVTAKLLSFPEFLTAIILATSALKSLWNMFLSKVSFTSDTVFFNDHSFDYESIVNFHSIEFDQKQYYIFKTNAKNWKQRYFITEFGDIGFITLYKLIVKTIKAEDLPEMQFIKLLREKSNIPARKFT